MEGREREQGEEEGQKGGGVEASEKKKKKNDKKEKKSVASWRYYYQSSRLSGMVTRLLSLIRFFTFPIPDPQLLMVTMMLSVVLLRVSKFNAFIHSLIFSFLFVFLFDCFSHS